MESRQIWKALHATLLLLTIVPACTTSSPAPTRLPFSKTTPFPTSASPPASPAPYATILPSPAPPTMPPLPTASFPLTEALALVRVLSDPHGIEFQSAALQPDGTLRALPISFRLDQLTPSRTWLVGTTEIRVTENGQENSLTALNLLTGQVQTTALVPNYWISNLVVGPDDQAAFVEWNYPSASHWNVVHVDLTSGQRTIIYEGQDECTPPGWCLPRLLGWSEHAGGLLTWGNMPSDDNACTSPLEAIDIETKQVRRILRGLTANLVRLSPDGARLVYSSYNPDYPPDNYVPQPGTPSNELYLLDLTTVQSTTLVSEQSGGLFTSHPVFSANSQSVLIWRGRYVPGEPERPRAEDLLAISLNTAKVTVIDRVFDPIQPYGAPVACPDGSFLYAVCSSDSTCELRRVSTEPPQATSLPYRFNTRTWVVACLR